MELSPNIYRTLVRPKWFTKLYISDMLKTYFNFENKRVLDFGCGVGSSSTMFNPQNYLGIDIDYRRVDYARSLYPQYKFAALNGNILPVSDNTFDYILVFSVLHHISSEDLPYYIREFHRVLNNNGKVIAVEPCLFRKCFIANYCMSTFDKGKYIKHEADYLKAFDSGYFKTKVLKRFNQLLFYNKLFFTASPKY